MDAGGQAFLPALERVEAKYQIPSALIEPISQYARIYCDLDKYSLRSPDEMYTINSLYLDTPDYLFLRRKLAKIPQRFNMRIRTYGDNPEGPVFFEIKHKNNGIVKKIRIKHSSEEARRRLDFMQMDEPVKNPDAAEDKFQQILSVHPASARVMTRYHRKAYVSNVDDYGRVTFDQKLKYIPQSSYNLFPDENTMNSYDSTVRFAPGCNTVLELKCYAGKVPLWMIDLVRKFDLHRTNFSKFSNSMLECLAAEGFSMEERQAQI